MADRPDPSLDPLFWETRLPIASNVFLLRDLLRVVVLGATAPALLVAALALWEADYQQLPSALSVFAIALGGLVALMLLAVLVMAGGAATEFAVTDERVVYLSRSRRLKWAARLAVVGGAVRGGSTGALTAGTGLLSASRADFACRWNDLLWARCDDRRRLIHLHDDWHTVLRLWCTPDNYQQVKTRVLERLPDQRPTDAPRPAAHAWLTGLIALLAAALIFPDGLPLDVPLPLDAAVVLLAITAGFSTRRPLLLGTLVLAALAGSLGLTWTMDYGLETTATAWRWALAVETAAYATLALIGLAAVRRGIAGTVPRRTT